MALNINGVEPTSIVYNGTDLTVLRYGATNVWGKPYSLILNASDCIITVSRKSSNNQHATETALESGSKIYYGDVIAIAVMPTTSQYALDSVKINGVEQTDISPTFEKDFTVTSSIVVTATAGRTSKTWVTKFSGSKTFTNNVSLANDPITQDTPTNSFEYTNIPLSNFGITESVTTSPIRITATITVGVGGTSITKTENTTLSARQLSTSWETVTNTVNTTVGANNYSVGAYGRLRAETTNLGLGIYTRKASSLNLAKSQITIVVTKVEQYLSSVQKTLSAPTIVSVNWTGSDEIYMTVKNNNSVQVTANTTFYDVDDNVYGTATSEIAANSEGNYALRLSSSGEYASGWYIVVYFTADGYTQSDEARY